MEDGLQTSDIVPVSVADLSFDPNNPRLAGFDVVDKEIEMIRFLWDTMDVREIVLSIAASGYFKHEPMIVAKEHGKHVVIEGNRRLAAVKLLLQPEVASQLKASVPPIDAALRHSLQEIPALYGTRRDVWRYLGFKHVNGPAKWSSYAKAKYVAEVHRTYQVPLEDIARQIGDNHNTVRRLYRGLMVIEQAERLGVYERTDRWRQHFAFSHLYVGLQYLGVGAFLALRPVDDEEQDPVPAHKTDQLRELLVWLYGSKSERKPPAVQSQNPHLRQLDAVLANTESLAAMRAGADLSVAFEASRPSSNQFEEALVGAKQSLQKARSTLSIGYDGSKALLGVASAVADLAYDLHEEMERKSTPRRDRRRAKA